MSNKVKRHCRMVTVSQKIEAVKRVDNGESKASVARDLGVPESTLRGWCKNERLRSMSRMSCSSRTDSSEEPASKRLCTDWPRTTINSNKDLDLATCSAVAPNFIFGTDVSPLMSFPTCTTSFPALKSYANLVNQSSHDIYTKLLFLTHMKLISAQHDNHDLSLDLRERDTYRTIKEEPVSEPVISPKALKKGQKLQMALEKIYCRNAMKADVTSALHVKGGRDKNEIEAYAASGN